MEIVNNSFGWTMGIEKVDQNTRQILKDIDIVKQLNKFIIDSNFKLKASCRVFTVLYKRSQSDFITGGNCIMKWQIQRECIR